MFPCTKNRDEGTCVFPCTKNWESPNVSHKTVFVLLMPEIRSYEMAQMLQKPVFALAGLDTQTQNATFFERKRPKLKPKSNRKKMIAMRFLNASVLPRKALNRSLSSGFLLGNLLPEACVLKYRVLERKRRPNANASVLGTAAF